MAKFPKLYHPEHPRNGEPEPLKRKTLTPCHQEEYEALLRIGWLPVPEDWEKKNG